MRRVLTVIIGCLLPLAVSQIACEVKQVQVGSPSVDVSIAPSEWALVELDSQPLPAVSQALTLMLAEDGKTNGFAGCNQFAGTYTLAADQLTFSPLAATRKFCGETMNLEQQYLSALASTRTYRQTANSLELIGDNGTVARFQKR
jgi:heat shock protein HslJ